MEPPPDAGPYAPRFLAGRLASVFLTSKLSILFLLASLAAGAAALLRTPREEEPQIVVPFADVFISMPGAPAEEVEKLAATPAESLLWQIDGVENVYSASSPGEAVVTVRFRVGEDRERSLVKIWNQMMSHADRLPPGLAGWTVKPVEVDDVPVVCIALWSRRPGTGLAELRRIADEVLDKLQRVPSAGKAEVFGGLRRKILVRLDPGLLAARNLAPADVVRALRGANVNVPAGTLFSPGLETRLEAGAPLESPADAASIVVGVSDRSPIYLRDVAAVSDGADEPEATSRIGFGPAGGRARFLGGPEALRAAGGAPPAGDERPQVTIALAKRKGTNAVTVSRDILEAVERLRGVAIPTDVVATVVRDSGRTADRKVNELVKHLLIAIGTILVLLALSLGPREALVVALAVPTTLSVTLACDLVFGYTVNRVTLFALILSLGLLVDDPIVGVENIFRHLRLGRRSPRDAAVEAIDEIGEPTILATLAVIVSFLPLFFITGMMGPYMAPMAFNVPIAMLVSLLVSFTLTPWATLGLLKGGARGGHAPGARPGFAVRLYGRLLRPIVETRARALKFLGFVALALALSAGLAVAGLVPMKMLPFDDKNELSIVIDAPAGTPLEDTDALARRLARFLATVPEVTDFETAVGLASPMDFNGLVRHSYLRRGGRVGDIRVNLLPKESRVQASHAIALRIRPEIERIARTLPGTSAKIVESPPGPPVLSTLVAEVYGPPEGTHADLVAASKSVRGLLERVPGAADVDDFSEASRRSVRIRIDREKAALHGIPVAEAAEAIRLANAGVDVGALHVPNERLPLDINVRLPRPDRSSARDLLAVRVRAAGGALVPLSEIASAVDEPDETTIYHKDLRRVAWVVGEAAGRSPVSCILDLKRSLRANPLPMGYKVALAGEGEWKITVDVFRDLGIAFAAALAMIYLLLVAQTGSLRLPLVFMAAIPLTVVGIMPGFFLLNALFSRPVGPYADPIFFTATGMIGMIALGGIVIRNSIILIDFIGRIRARNPSAPLADVLVEAGATRLRPILLTAAAAMFGSFVITLDPIFSGLAWSFIFGIFASTAFTLLVIPALYSMGGPAAKAKPDEAPPSPNPTGTPAP